jgi:putative heme-binding domain-containing protein
MRFLIPLLLLTSALPLHAEPVALFDGQTFAGWEGDTTTVWRIEDGALTAGSLEVRQEKNDFLATQQTYANFDLRLKWKLEGSEGFVNGGVQFRSRRIPNHHEMIGYQADLGAGYDGALYDESRRRKMLAQPTPEALAKASKPLGEWNDYRIQAQGPRIQIWLNGVLTVDYTETEPGIAMTGHIAVQIHGNATARVAYKELVIEELPGDAAPAAQQALALKPQEVIALVGGSNMERTRFHGFLQSHLITAQPTAAIKVRNFGWEGDTVFEQWRDDGDVEQLDPRRQQAERRIQQETGSTSWRQQRDWRQQLSEVGATTVIAQFGQMEALNGTKQLPAFVTAYDKLIGELADAGRQLILVSPMPFEGAMAKHNVEVVAYSLAIGELARRHQLRFIDLSLLSVPGAALTDNGWQLNEHGHQVIADHLMSALGLPSQPNENVRQQVLEMERLWFDYWRPMNWAFLTGDRTNVPYSKDWKDTSKRIFPQEMEDFLPLLNQAEDNIRKALAGEPITPIGVRSSIPVEPPSTAPQSPEEELASFTILEGFEVNLFASEADGVVKPIQMRWDERGRLWVACAVSYPQIKPGEKANDYVLVCEDTDGDGRADKFHKFVEGLFMPSGLELGDGGLYVAQGTELLHFQDTDGDGKADAKRIVLGGFGTADSHQMINCINWGFGGELWFTQGHHIYSRVETPYGVETLNRAGLWRLRPRTGHLDPFFQFSSAGANCWGVITTDYGQPFHKSGANIGGYYSTPGLVRSKLAVDAQPMNLFLAPIKQVGMEFVGSRHFPAEMQGRVIIGGYYGNTLEQHELTLVDGRYESKLLPNLIETKNNVFRPVEVRGGPDGALYVADWYNPIIGHYQASYRHPDRDKAHGRIWRVSRQDGPKIQPPELATASIETLLELLDSPERWVTYQVKRLLFEKDRAAVVKALDAWVTNGCVAEGQKTDATVTDYRRLQALSLYEAHESPRPALLETLLRASDARIRAYATRTLSTWARSGVLANALTLLETQVADADPLVRLEAIVAASYLPEPRAAVVAARALDHPFNAYHQHALTKTLDVLQPLGAPLWKAGKLEFDQDEHLIFALQHGWMDPPKNATANRQDLSQLMREQVLKHADNPARQTTWLKALAAVANADDVPFIFNLAATNASVLAALNTGRPQQAQTLLEPLMASSDAALRHQALRLAGRWKVAAFTERIRQLALAEHSPQALDAWVQLAPEEVVKQVLNQLSTQQPIQPQLTALVSRAEGHAALMRTLQKPDALSPAEAKLALQTLNQLGRSDAKLAPLLMQLAGLNADLPAYTKAYLDKIVHTATTVGDPAEGKKVYEQAGCIACHLPGAAQSKIGPDLSAIARGLPIDMIVTEVVWPALNVKEGYEAATVTLKDGTVLTGFKHTDTADTLTLRDFAGELKPIQKTSAQSIQTGGSVMPDGLTTTLTELQLAHLIRYLSELGK